MKVLSLLLVSLVSLGYAAKLRVYEASSTSPRTGEPLPAVSTLCPSMLFDGSFTIECVSDAPATSATFMVDGKVIQTERVVPYILTGDNTGFARPWSYPRMAKVQCMVANGEMAESVITFKCDGDDDGEMMPEKDPEAPKPPASDGDGEMMPEKDPEAPKPPASDGDGEMMPEEESEAQKPPASDGDGEMMPEKDPEAAKPPAPTKTPEPQAPTEPKSPEREDEDPMPPSSGADGSIKCLKIKATSYVGMKSAGWVNSDGGMAFKPDDPDKGIDGQGDAPLTYTFKAPADGRYVISLDMKTSNGVDYNDVWVEFPSGGVSLEKPGSRESENGWVKAYHNDDGRSVAAFSVDHNPHVISTQSSLKAGQEYTIKIGGRSTKVTFYSIIMFNCSGDGCMDSDYYRKGINQCS